MELVRGAWGTLVVVACLALLVWLTAGGRASADGGLDHSEEREQVMSLTDQFVKRLGTYSPDMLDDSGQMPDYRDQVREVITPKFAADFEKNAPLAEATVKQAGVGRTCTVFSTGGCKSWYMDAHGVNRTLWSGMTWQYWLATRRFRPVEYEFTRLPQTVRS